VSLRNSTPGARYGFECVLLNFIGVLLTVIEMHLFFFRALSGDKRKYSIKA
jgi:hypothetical protein